jgi:hypothetical protein
MLKGEQIVGCRTLKSQYDMDSVEVGFADGRWLRIKAFELVKALKKCEFTERKAIRHTYLEVVEKGVI